MNQSIMKNVVVVNSQFEVVTRFTTPVAEVVVNRFDKVDLLAERAIAHHVSAVVNDSFWADKPFSVAPSAKEKTFAQLHSISAITGGAIADALLGRTIKDIDTLFVTAEPGHYNYNGQYRDYFNFEGVQYPLAHVLDWLTMPHCYARINGVFQVYKSEKYALDFLFRTMSEDERTASPHDILNTIVSEYDQDIKLGFYYNGEFIIHEDMYAAMQNERVGFNRTFLSGLSSKGESVTGKEINRLEKARKKYTPDTIYSETILSEYSLESVSEHGYKSVFSVDVPLYKIHPNLV